MTGRLSRRDFVTAAALAGAALPLWPSDALARVPGQALEFRTIGQANETRLVPLSRILDERYAVYWTVRASA